MLTQKSLFLLLVLMTVIGCGKTDPVPSAEEKPLTLEQWKTLPVQEKYEVDTFERLKQGEPKFREQREWDKFARDTLMPAKKRDFPGGYK
jgi:hypothetical protein